MKWDVEKLRRFLLMSRLPYWIPFGTAVYATVVLIVWSLEDVGSLSLEWERTFSAAEFR